MDFDRLVEEIKNEYVSPKTLELKTRKVKTRDKNGDEDILEVVKSCRYNVYQIISNHHKFSSLVFDEFAYTVRYKDEKISDEIITEIAIWFEKIYNITVAETDIKKVLYMVAKERPVNPLVDYFNSQIDEENPDLMGWDKTPRIDTVLIDYFGVLDTELHRAYSRKFFIGAIRRALFSTVEKPVKMDVALVAMGEQAIGKSTAVNTLALKEEWFSDAPLDISSKDYNYHIQGKLLYELAEWASRAKNIQLEKAFFTTKVDRYRPVHKTYQVEVPRRVSFWINVNRKGQFNDSTGSRRFWAFVCGLNSDGSKWKRGRMVDIAALKENALQIWLEARYYAQQKTADNNWVHPHWLTTEEEKLRETQNELFSSQHPWTGRVLEAVKNCNDKSYFNKSGVHAVTIDDIMTELEFKTQEANVKSKTIIEMILRANGFDKIRVSSYKSQGRKIVWAGRFNWKE